MFMAEQLVHLHLSRERVSNRGRRGLTQSQGHFSTISSMSVGFGAESGVFVSSLPLQDGVENDDGMTAAQLLRQTEDGMDLLTWCEQCSTSMVGECLIHGTVIAVTDNKLPSRARLSLPSILTFKRISNGENEEKEGVFAKRLIKPRTQFGPLEAPPMQAGVSLPSDVFDVRVLKAGRQEQLDLSQEEACNWMMFVRPAQCDQEANLAAYQLQDRIYYISTETIHQMTELRVWYLPKYGQQFGKHPLPPTLPTVQILPESSEDTEGPAMPGDLDNCRGVVGTRYSAAMPSGKLMCGSCNTPFRSLPLLVAHNCSVLDEGQTADTSSRPARRKSRPRKVAGTGKRGRPLTRLATGATPTPTSTALPSVTTLIKTEVKTEVAVPDSTVSDVQQDLMPKKRGRPKGSKNKPLAEGEVRPARKVLEIVKRKRPKFDCSYCDRSFYSEEQHKVHEAEHTGTKPYVCHYPDCGKGFGSKFKYWRHSLVHEQPQNKTCPYCDRKFNRIDHLKNHIATHNSNRQQWACEKCGKQYLYHSTYVFHMAVHSAQEDAQLACNICATVFSNREALLKHVNTHNRYKPDQNRRKSFECPKCQKKFTTTKDVRRHLVTHTKDRSFLCEFCPQTFARKDHLRRHYRSNHKKEVLEQAALTGISTQCAICLKTFKTEKHLDYHVKSTHTQDEDTGGLLKAVKDKQLGGMGAKPSKVVVVQGAKITIPDSSQMQQQVQQQQQQQLSLFGGVHPVQLHINTQYQQQQQHEQQQNVLQAGSYITSLPGGGVGDQAVEVVADGGDFTHPMVTLKTIPCRYPSGQVLAPAPLPSSSLNSQPAATSSLRQILSYHPQQSQLQQDAQQVTQPQQVYSNSEITSTPTIVSMLSSSRADNFLDLAGKGQAVYAPDSNGHLKPLPTQWVLAGNTATIPEVSTVPTSSDSGDHCYATGAITTTSSDGRMKLPPLPTLGGKLMGSVAPISDVETLRLLQSCQAGGLLGSAQTQTSSSGLQATWDSLSDLMIPLDMMPALSGSQASVINLPVTVNVPVTGGSVNVTASVTLSQPT